MRQIKFRAWHLAEKKMLEVDELNHIASWSFEGMLGVNGVNRSIGIQGGVHNDCVVMQFTGLRDKNGKDIYEGDIVNTVKEDGVKVYYDRGNYWAGIYQLAYLGETGVEIIGNIHENPELINR